MNTVNAINPVRVVSKGFALLRAKEIEQDKRIPLDTVSKETGLAKLTVRKFLAQGSADVSGSPLSAAAVIANYLGVEIGELLDVQVGSEAGA